jgi:quercetin dioxygenase-like cupin family protein
VALESLPKEWGSEARALGPGDVVIIAPGVKHWHGAAKDSWFEHLSIAVPGEECSNEWLEPVDDSDYLAL